MKYCFEEIKEITEKYFSFLITDYGYRRITDNNRPFSYEINYTNGDLLVSIEYAYRYDYLNPIIYNLLKPKIEDKTFRIDLEKVSVAENFHLEILKFESNTIFGIMYAKKHPVDANEVSPKKIGLEESYKIVSEFFKEFGVDFLTGEIWFNLWENKKHNQS